jgi:hypothetical protein
MMLFYAVCWLWWLAALSLHRLLWRVSSLSSDFRFCKLFLYATLVLGGIVMSLYTLVVYGHELSSYLVLLTELACDLWVPRESWLMVAAPVTVVAILLLAGHLTPATVWGRSSASCVSPIPTFTGDSNRMTRKGDLDGAGLSFSVVNNGGDNWPSMKQAMRDRFQAYESRMRDENAKLRQELLTRIEDQWRQQMIEFDKRLETFTKGAGARLKWVDEKEKGDNLRDAMSFTVRGKEDSKNGKKQTTSDVTEAKKPAFEGQRKSVPKPAQGSQKTRRSVMESSSESSDSDSDESSSSSDSDSSETSLELFSAPGFLLGSKSPKKKRGKGLKADKKTELKEGDKKRLLEKSSLEEVLAEVREIRAEQKRQKQASQALTDEEKAMTREQLLDHFARQRRIQRFGQHDRALTEEELQMDRETLRRHLVEENNRAWIEKQAARGRHVYVCDQCGKRTCQGDRQHTCMRVSWQGATQRRRGVPFGNQIVASQTGRGPLQMRVVPYVDRETFEKEYAEMTKVKQQFDAKDAAARGMIVEQPNMTVTAASASPPPPPPQANLAVVQPYGMGFQQGYQCATG